MVHQIVEIKNEHKYLNLNRGFVQISSRHNEEHSRHQVPIDDVESLVLSAHSTTVTKALLIALAERGACTVLCDANHNPSAIVLPPLGVCHAAAVARSQAGASIPLNKRLWRQVISTKILHQSQIIAKTSQNKAATVKLAIYAKEVQSGDITNREGTAARLYWQALFGKDFRRDRQALGVNSYLNYGYSLLRASTARAVCGAGLLPVLGMFHKNESNAMALVDDLMEPYRPLIDLAVWRLAQQKKLTELAVEDKKALTKILYYPVTTSRGKSLLINSLYGYTSSLALCYRKKESKLFKIAILADENSYVEEEEW